MRNASSLSLALLVLAGCGGAQPEVVNEPPAEEPVVEAPPPRLVDEAFQHEAMQIALVGTLDPATQITAGEINISGTNGAFELLGGEFSAPVPARWVENIITSLQAPLLGLDCPLPQRATGRRPRRKIAAIAPTPLFTIVSGGVTTNFFEGCTARRVRPADLAVAASDVVGRIGRVTSTASRLELLRREAIGQPIPDASFTFTTTELDDGPEAPEGGRTYHRRIAWSTDHFALCTMTEEDPEATGENACFAVHEVFVTALAHQLREAGCTPGPIDDTCSAYGDLRMTLENAIEWSPGFDLSDVGTQP